MAKKITRSGAEHAIFGASAKLKENVLPTYTDVMKYFLYTRENLKANNGGREPTVHQIVQIVCLRGPR